MLVNSLICGRNLFAFEPESYFYIPLGRQSVSKPLEILAWCFLLMVVGMSDEPFYKRLPYKARVWQTGGGILLP
jgi:hypothetical protein